MTETRSTAPPFTHKGVTFENWWIPDGVNEIGKDATKGVWLSTCGRISCGKTGGWYWAAVDKKYVVTRCPTLLGAMKEGIAAMAKGRMVA